MERPSTSIERSFIKEGVRWIAGVDEAGRGALAGPVVAGAVLIEASTLLRLKRTFAEVRDSKLLTSAAREALFEKLTRHDAVQWGTGMVDSINIDEMNIHHATLEAMRRAISALSQEPEIILVDGIFPIPNIICGQEYFPHGDRRIFSIAAASIIAKVTRDRMMKEYAKQYPDYGFEKHKGYGTKLHHTQLVASGPSPIHRMSYAPVAIKAAKTARLVFFRRV